MTIYRDATPLDRAFVLASWASSYKNAHAAGMIASEDWPIVMHAQISKLLDRPGVRTIVAADSGRGRRNDFLYGFVAGALEPTPAVFYLYVKSPYRSQPDGFGGRTGPRHARALLSELGIDPEGPFVYACKTAVVSRLADKIPRARFVPGVARYVNYQEVELRG